MTNRFPHKTAFWQYDTGPKAGIKHAVTNLGWLIKHAQEVKRIEINKSVTNGADFIAHMTANRRYVTRFEDFNVACWWIKRPSMNHVEIEMKL